MKQSAQQELSDLQAHVLHAIHMARNFAELFREEVVGIDGLSSLKLDETLKRLDEADLFATQDESVWPRLERGLVTALNDIREGYGTYALREDTRYDQMFLPQLERGRRLMQSWKSFMSARQALIDRRRANQIVELFFG